MAKNIKVIINDDGELQAIYVPKELGKYKVSVIDYYEDDDKAEKQWNRLKKDADEGTMIAIY